MDLPNAATELAEGYLDGLKGDILWGWAWFPDRPDAVAVVEAVAGGVVIASALADRPRQDLKDANKRGGACAFEMSLPRSALTAGVTVEVRIAGGAPLPPGPLSARIEPEAAEASASAPDIVVVDRVGVHLDALGPEILSGWARRLDDPATPVSLTLFDGDMPVLTFAATGWRVDLAEMRQGDGRGAFSLSIPAALRDGAPHLVDLRTDNGVSVLPAPILTTFAAAPDRATPPEPAPAPAVGVGAPQISVIVNFYNMRREAERTLTSLSRAYQRGVESRPYEVICVDNGSSPPLEAAWVESFGPEFRLVRPAAAAPSPCAAINAAAAQARGAHLAIMIDGAHVLTPGALAEAFAAIDEDPGAVIALRHWFVGGDQRWLAEVGYSREAEDILFAKIAWPSDGYELFRIGAPIVESPNSWFDGLSESNCLFLPAALYARLGGLSETFLEPGGGYANLDLFKRAADATPGGVVCLIGEASFHQFHHGATTNVSDAEKDRRVRGYHQAYRTLRGAAFESIAPSRIKLRGVMRSPLALTSRQGPPFPLALGVTDRIRPIATAESLDEGLRLYLQAAYVELQPAGERARWLGQSVALPPGDLISIQDILTRVRPSRIICTSPDDGLIAFIQGVLALLELEHSRIIRVLTNERSPAPRVDIVATDAQASPQALARIEGLIGAEDAVAVLFEPAPYDAVPIETLAAYATFVSVASYMVVLNTVVGQPWLGYSRNWRLKAIALLRDRDPALVVDPSFEQHLVTTCAGGYLKRIRRDSALQHYDPSLDELASL
jgi:cephalosporin hydroxylase